MPNKKSDDIELPESSFQDVADAMSKCHHLIQILEEKQKQLSRSGKNSVALHLNEEQLEYLKHCVNMELCDIIEAEAHEFGFDDEDED